MFAFLHAADSDAPARKITWLRRLIALFGAPMAWMSLVNIDQGLAAYACYPHAAPLGAPMWSWLPFALFLVGFLALAAAIAAACVALGLWRGARHAKDTRAHFIALISLLSSGIFLTAIIFDAFNLFMVSPCQNWL